MAEPRYPTLEPFRILSPEERERYLAAYLRFLKERDGDYDLAGRRLSRRETFMRELYEKPVDWDGGIDVEAIQQHLAKTAAPQVDPRTAWVVAATKANESETYGVELEIDGLLARGEAAIDPRELFVILEERYHGQLLREAARTCGFDFEPTAPPWHRRLMIHIIYHLPERARWVPVLCGEALGSVVLKLLRDRSDLFAAQPEVESRLRELLHEIWVDEVGHVGFIRARLSPLGIRAARLLLPIVVLVLMRDVPGLRQLGCSLRSLLADARRAVEIPPEMAWIEDGA